MKKLLLVCFAVCLAWSTSQAGTPEYEMLTKDFVKGKVSIQSFSVITFGPEGILFIGDARSGSVVALDLNDRTEKKVDKPFQLADVEGKLASMLGTDADGVIIHDMAVNPISKHVYLAVSKADANELGFWRLPNDIADANILIRIDAEGKMQEVALDNVSHSIGKLPKVTEGGKHRWRKTDIRTEAITDIGYADGKLYVAGLSNEEFASSLKVMSFPFKDDASNTTVEVWHIAHAKSETEAPIRTLLPYELNGEKYLLASYTCTPFVSIPISSLKNGEHVKSKTLAEFGAGNMPVDIVSYKKNGKDYIVMSNMSKALIRIDPEDIAKQKAITSPLEDGQYTSGLPHDVLSRVGITQIDNYGEGLLTLQRMPNGSLNLVTYPPRWL
ncbi:MAG: hypothetical protein AAFX87_17920 [Bacteroidota bacterium]